MPRIGYASLTLEDDLKRELDLVAKAEKCKTRPEVVRMLIRDWKRSNPSKSQNSVLPIRTTDLLTPFNNIAGVFA